MRLFLHIQKNSSLKDLREELKEQYNKRRSEEYVMEICLDRVIETIDVLVDSYAVRTSSVIASAPFETTEICKFVFLESGIYDIYRKVCKPQEDILQQKKKKILASMWYEQIFEKLKTDDKLRLYKKGKSEKDAPFPYKSAIE